MRLDSERAYHRDLEQFQHEQVLFYARVPESIAPRRIWRKRVQCEQPGASGSRLPLVAGFSETGGFGGRRLTVSDVLRIPPVQRRPAGRVHGSLPIFGDIPANLDWFAQFETRYSSFNL